ncbi:unnamed protein product [Fraxinus pennsylvanica]|uniref:Uncharacterized protein n=1 Tax=Fraxinus pennsylvanica TaxID=56036 RepID=A0AAD2EDP4_9LAMI|nr:unnamed protein product [Fraxinus pennsylvanica]
MKRLYCSSVVKTWILVSNLNLDNQYIILLPLDKTLEGSISGSFVNSWMPPWGSTVVDDIAPMFREIMEIGLDCFDNGPNIENKESGHSRISKLYTVDNRIRQLLIKKYLSEDERFTEYLDETMLCWENLPILKNEEVYHMPSVGSILAIHVLPRPSPVFDKFCTLTVGSGQGAYKYFTPNNELIVALKSHDLYVYSGHGDGLYIDL